MTSPDEERATSASPARHITLGVHVGHDAAAAIFSECRLQYAEEEERHTGRKAHNGCPWNAIDAALEAVSARDDEVRTVAVTWGLASYLECRRELAEHARRVDNEAWFDRRQREITFAREEIEALKKRFRNAELLDFPHHLAHAACAVCFAPRLETPGEESLVLGVVADALGDAESLTVFSAPDATRLLVAPEVALRRSPRQSIGFFYKRGSEAFGFTGSEACGYLMALSGCDDGEEHAEVLRNELFRRDSEGPLSFEPARFDPFRGFSETAGRCFSEELHEHLGVQQPGGDFLSRAGQANAIQRITEEYLEDLLRHLVSTLGPRRIFLSGGVFLNCIALGKLTRAFPDVDLVVCPVKKDSGTAIGAALLAEVRRTGALANPHGTLRLGTAISGREPDWADAAGQYEVFSSRGVLVSRLADDIAAGTPVALVDGPGEFGPRALGARSLLATPSSRELSARLNEQVKRRHSFQPFAGAFLEEEFRRLHPGQAADVFMSHAVRLDAGSQAKLGGIVHRDGSTRVQLVPLSEDSILRELLVELASRGAPAVVLNSSLNAKGEPIARTPADVLRTCARLGVETIYTPTGRRTPCS